MSTRHDDYEDGSVKSFILSKKPSERFIAKVFAGVTILGLGLNSYYTVQPSEMAGVRRFGNVITTEPVGPGGPYFKLPIFDQVDRLTVSKQIVTDEQKTPSADNQEVTLGSALTYEIPKDGVFNLLYHTGRSGSSDIDASIKTTLAGRIGQTISKQNTSTISLDRDKLQASINVGAAADLQRLYGIKVDDFKITRVDFDEGFKDSVRNAVQQKNQALAQEYAKQGVAAQGEQMKITAAAQATQMQISAEANARRVKLEADASNYASKEAADAAAFAVRAQGDATAGALRAQRAAFGTDEAFIAYQVSKQWSGNVPMTSITSAETGAGAVLNPVNGSVQSILALPRSSGRMPVPGK